MGGGGLWYHVQNMLPLYGNGTICTLLFTHQTPPVDRLFSFRLVLNLCQQIYTTKTIVCSCKETLKTPLHTWPLCFAYGKLLRNPSRALLPLTCVSRHAPRCHLPVLSLAV